MPASREQILQLIYDSVDEVNAQLGVDQHVRKDPGTSLLVGADGLDSLGFINLITSIEERAEESFGRFVSLSDDGSGTAAYETISQLVNHIEGQLRS